MKTILGFFKMEPLDEEERPRVPDATIPDRTALPNLRLEIARIISFPSPFIYSLPLVCAE
jgi:hypothetical protein